MKTPSIRSPLIAVGLALLLTAGWAPSTAVAADPSEVHTKSHADVCARPASAGAAVCHAKRRTDATGTPARPGAARPPQAGPNVLGNSGAYDPSYLRSAYNLTAASGGAGQTVAIVDAYDDPSAESDLAYYRSYFGLPPCSTANGCFSKVDQNGVQGSYPRFDAGWAQEISLDLDMVSAICPNCRILLVEASSASFTDLGAAVNTAASLGAKVISNSYGASEFSSETTYDAYYNHPGIVVTVSSGDAGYGVEFPAASQYVTAVGGTTLNQATNTGTRSATETAWSGGGSGCSAYEPKPSWQTDAGCGRRTLADVSAVADPNTGVWVYDAGGWYIFGGTSVSAPIVGAVYALAGNSSVTYGSYPYKNPASLFDIVSGSNGSCGSAYLCTAVPGYDGPTGLGTPNGTASFMGTPPGRVSFSSAPQTLTAGSPSGEITVQLLGSSGVPQPPSSPVAVTLSASSAVGGYSSSSSGPWSATLSVTVTAPSSTSPTFFYQDTKAGSPTLTAAASGYSSGTQPETVNPAALATISVAPDSATVAQGATRRFTASGADPYANPLSASGAAWSVSAGTPGAVSPTSGSSTTFTASSTATGSGQVTAAVGSVSGSASVTVVVTVTVPGAPTLLAAKTDTTKGIDLTWNAPTSNGGAAITSYRIYRSGSSGKESSLVSVTCGATSCSYHDTSTNRGRRYYYQVAAVNTAGTGPRSSEASAVAK